MRPSTNVVLLRALLSAGVGHHDKMTQIILKTHCPITSCDVPFRMGMQIELISDTLWMTSTYRRQRFHIGPPCTTLSHHLVLVRKDVVSDNSDVNTRLSVVLMTRLMSALHVYP